MTTLTPVELAGRLSLATGKPISPKAIVGCYIGWQAATETMAGLVKKYGKTGLSKMVRRSCSERALWAHRTNAGTLKWLQCVLEAHFLSPSRSPSGNRTRDQREQHGELDLVELCRANFAQAYNLWLTDEVALPARERTGLPPGGS